MRIRSWAVIALSVGVVGGAACLVALGLWTRHFLSESRVASDEALAWNDRDAILDAKASGGYRYVLVRVWTTVPDLMQRVDLYCFDSARMKGEPGRADFKYSRQVLSENLEDNFHRRDETGGYKARFPTRGAIDLGKKVITIEFDSGPPQLVPIPDPAVRARCPALVRPSASSEDASVVRSR